MKKLFILLVILFSIIQIQAQPLPQDSTDLVWSTKTDLSAFKEKYLETCNEIGALKAKNIVLEKKISEVNEEIRKRNQEKLLLNTKLETCIQKVEKMIGEN